LRFTGSDAFGLAGTLSGKRIEIPAGCLPTTLVSQLQAGGFIVSSDFDELAAIRERFQDARRDTPMVLTLTTTMDCNLGCYYCYEDRSQHRLEVRDIAPIVELARQRLAVSGKRSLHVDWYGGEPLMNREFMEAGSIALQELCVSQGIRFTASIISNGTCWPEDVAEFVRRHQIRQVQISFDGLRDHHDRRRRYRKEYAPEVDASSFDRAVTLVDQLLEVVRVDIRLNIDRANQVDLVPFINFARARGWFTRPYPAVIQPARLAAYSERSAFMRHSQLSVDEFETLRTLVKDEVGCDAKVEDSEVPDGVLAPRNSVCAALAEDSVVVGANRSLYRCGLQVSEDHRAVGTLRIPSRNLLRVIGNPSDEEWWRQFDPTTLPTCSRCSFLPICWGGCPKKHLEQDTGALAEQGAYWRRTMPQLIATTALAEATPEYVFTEDEQFR
jgi:uncharacterized protein